MGGTVLRKKYNIDNTKAVPYDLICSLKIYLRKMTDAVMKLYIARFL